MHFTLATMDKFLHIIKRYIPVKLFKLLQPAYHWLFSALAAAWHGWPSNKLIVIGVTGTTGKTTSVYLMAKMLAAAGYKTGFTSTALFNDGRKEWLNNKKMTMVGRFFTQKILKSMVKNNCQFAIVETTSQGIEQFRHKFINYDILVFTGLYPEHLEAHGGFENYKQAKGKLFAQLKHCRTKYTNDKKQVIRAENGFRKIESSRTRKTIIANGDDEQADFFLSFWAEDKLVYAAKSENKAEIGNDEVRILKYGGIKSSQPGVSFKVAETEIKLNLLGEYNAANAMTAVCLGFSQEISLQDIKNGLEKVKAIPGRMEMITSPQPPARHWSGGSPALADASSDAEALTDKKAIAGKQGEGVEFTVIVDYAFEPEALKKIYETILRLEHNKIIQVLGSAGGGRDVARRPKLGRLAGAQADLVIVTNEDPYDDDPKLIIDQVARGAANAGKILDKDLFKIEDRREAIKKALALAQAGDIVLITGKGCEQAICAAGGARIPWDDRQVVREELGNLTHNTNNINCC